MSEFCQNCGRIINQSSTPCPFCGYISQAQQPTQQQSAQPQNTSIPPVQNPQQCVFQQPQYQQQYIPVQAPQQFIPQQPQYHPDPSVVTTKQPRQKKPKKKHKLPGIVRFLIAIIIIAVILLGGWYAFGNMITLYIHSEDVVDTLNSGSLELEGTQSTYDELPNYIKDMLGEGYIEEDFGPVTQAVLPYISVERTKINGFFNNSTVKYEITAPDLENWLLNLEPGSFADENELLTLMIQYIETAPTRTAEVEINTSATDFSP